VNILFIESGFYLNFIEGKKMFEIFFTIIGVSWMVFEIVVGKKLHAKKEESDIQDSNSLIKVKLVIYISIALGFIFGGAGGIVNETAIFAEEGSRAAWIGLFVMSIGFLVRIIAIVSLKKFFTVNLAINHEHKLINKGLYRYIRHPSYLGSILSFVGMGMAFGNWFSLLFMVIPVTLLFAWRIGLEEKMLIEAFSSEYLEYKQRSWRLFPGVY